MGNSSLSRPLMRLLPLLAAITVLAGSLPASAAGYILTLNGSAVRTVPPGPMGSNGSFDVPLGGSFFVIPNPKNAKQVRIVGSYQYSAVTTDVTWGGFFPPMLYERAIDVEARVNLVATVQYQGGRTVLAQPTGSVIVTTYDHSLSASYQTNESGVLPDFVLEPGRGPGTGHWASDGPFVLSSGTTELYFAGSGGF